MPLAVSAETIDEIRRLRSLGTTYVVVAQTVGCSMDTARRYGARVPLDPSILAEDVPSRVRISRRDTQARTARPAWFEEDVTSMLVSRR